MAIALAAWLGGCAQSDAISWAQTNPSIEPVTAAPSFVNLARVEEAPAETDEHQE